MILTWNMIVVTTVLIAVEMIGTDDVGGGDGDVVDDGGDGDDDEEEGCGDDCSSYGGHNNHSINLCGCSYCCYYHNYW